jgi:hypothetical protein
MLRVAGKMQKGQVAAHSRKQGRRMVP